MEQNLNKKIQQLTALLHSALNKKVLWEEMQIISQKTFELQDSIMEELDRIEATETNIAKIQSAFAAREEIWGIVSQITARELEIKEKTHHKETPEERLKRHAEALEPDEAHTCCCGHHHDAGCCCDHHHAEKTCAQNHPKKTCQRKGKKCCRKTKK